MHPRAQAACLVMLSLLALAHEGWVLWDALAYDRWAGRAFGWELIDPVIAAAAAVIPLMMTSLAGRVERRWPFFLWLPCLGVAEWKAVQDFSAGVFPAGSLFLGFARMIAWLSIALLFLKQLPKRRPKIAAAGRPL